MVLVGAARLPLNSSCARPGVGWPAARRMAVGHLLCGGPVVQPATPGSVVVAGRPRAQVRRMEELALFITNTSWRLTWFDESVSESARPLGESGGGPNSWSDQLRVSADRFPLIASAARWFPLGGKNMPCTSPYSLTLTDAERTELEAHAHADIRHRIQK